MKRKHNKDTIYITDRTMNKMERIIKKIPTETSGLGRVVKIGDEKLLITDIYFFDQTNSSGSTVLSSKSVADFVTDWVIEGKNPEELKLWWHSHADINVYWSSTDESNIERLGNGWLISIVGNHKGHFLARIDFFDGSQKKTSKVNIKVVPHNKWTKKI
jgi:proteasome lid subunit RPN8/RPN11